MPWQRPIFPTDSLKDHARVHINRWCDKQNPSVQSGQSRNYENTDEFMNWSLRFEIAALYTTRAWTTLTEQTLLDAVPNLKTWNGRDKHLLSLCDFVNSAVKKVHIDHLVGIAREREEKEELEQMTAEEEAMGPFAFLELPYDIRVRVYDFLVDEKYSEGSYYGRGDDKFIEVPWSDHYHADEFHERVVFDFIQVCHQLRLEFLPRWHRAVGLRFSMAPYHEPKETETWLQVFGPSRVPLTRSFEFEFGDDKVCIELRGAQSRTVSGDTRQLTDIGVALRDELKVSSPELYKGNWEGRRTRALREPGFEMHLQRFAETLVEKSANGSVKVTVGCITQVMEYLQQRTVPPQEEDSGEDDCVVM
ncbi:unnamed protein product [Zymoseptoria tritici ST99CH_1A5]|nr:uncharacterized protein MYCGRDRAFT_96566 [Zymoseptoria tritici IPO323]EGP83637.1 hypothetical protein MYCGRDRAFT_96566 [Zymoseptoria tritici IPO323]SMR60355.1 unnamed protein product [Zymoseptoria tritici ST99CH_1E4]SMR63468.1 unnamed protein product [Zymoseptoria tritici ST99CH_3D1]SMY28812.1 unnamed protein product [Zymoseptoria tritici ST99CH_1A5]